MKDILIDGNKMYSPETCCFVPQEINSLFIKHKERVYPKGVVKNKNRFYAQTNFNNKVKNLGAYLTMEDAFESYSKAKKNHIFDIANKFKKCISEDLYNIIISYAE